MPEQIDRLSRGEVVEQGVQIGQVVGEPEVVGVAGVRQAVTAPVGCQNVAPLRHGVDNKLKRVGHVHPAVQEPQGRLTALGLTPFEQVVVEPPDRDKHALGGAKGGVHWHIIRNSAWPPD